MLRCSREAFAKCPTRHLCGTPNDATFAEGSECDKFNQQILNKPMTKADRIRAMSDEELAKIIMCPYDVDPDSCCPESTCLECCKKWLKQPAEEGADHG